MLSERDSSAMPHTKSNDESPAVGFDPLGAPGWILDTTVGPAPRLCQGDLIKFSCEKNALRRLGIVITADCDLEKNKHARLVTLVPILSVREIIEFCLIIEDCERKSAEIEKYLCKQSVD